MSQYYLNIFADLLEPNPLNPIVMPDPYDERKSLTTNIKMFYRMIRWSLRTNDRIEGLVNAYYLGHLLEERAAIPLERRKCQQTLTKHYILSCTRVYNLFVTLGVQQLYRTQRSSFRMFRQLKRNEYTCLVHEVGTMI